jgi:hypothetical protein
VSFADNSSRLPVRPLGVGDPDVIVRQTERTPGIPDQARGGSVRVQQLPREPAIDALGKRDTRSGIQRGNAQNRGHSSYAKMASIAYVHDTSRRNTTGVMLATAVTIGIGIAATSNASARDLYNSPQRGDVVRSYKPPAGQIYQRGFRDARTPEQKARRDFQLDGAYQ